MILRDSEPLFLS